MRSCITPSTLKFAASTSAFAEIFASVIKLSVILRSATNLRSTESNLAVAASICCCAALRAAVISASVCARADNSFELTSPTNSLNALNNESTELSFGVIPGVYCLTVCSKNPNSFNFCLNSGLRFLFRKVFC